MSRLALGSADLDRLTQVQRVLLAPLDHPTLDDWRRVVNRAAKRYLAADKATFLFPARPGKLLLSDDVDDSQLRQYPRRISAVYDQLEMKGRELDLVVFNRPLLFRDCLDDFYRSEYYNEYIVPLRCYDSLVATIPLDGAPRDRSVPWANRPVATLFFHHERPSGPKFGRRGLAMLRLLLPAFRSGARTLLRLEASQNELDRLLDGLDEGIALYEMDGRRIHRNPALSRMLRGPAARPLADGIEGAVRTVASFGQDAASARMDSAGVCRTVRIGTATYEVRGTLLKAALLAPRRMILVSVSGPSPEPRDPSDLRRRFGLTEREAQVALRLALRRSNREIAAELKISPHTARHHTERVLRKLDIGSRKRVAEALSRDPADQGR